MGRARPNVELTADLFARAMIAAAHRFDADPIAALSSFGPNDRQAVTAAASAVQRVTGARLADVCRILGTYNTSVYAARRKQAPAFLAAELAAQRAASYAAWRPEARASVVDDLELLIGPGVAAPLGIMFAGDPAEVLELDQVQPPVDLGEILQRLVDELEREEPRPLARGGAVSGGFGLVGEQTPASPRFAVRCPACGLGQGLHRSTCDKRRPRVGEANAVRVGPRLPATSPELEAQPIDEELLEILVDGEARNSMSLASAIDRKEMAVSSALARLEARGAVVSEVCESGPRRLAWRLSPAIAEAAE